MRCDRFREAASARLDGEPIGTSSAALAEHLTACADCARWEREATRLTRQVRLGTVDVPDLADAIAASIALPAGRVLRRRRWLRAGLVAAGVAQLVVAIPAIAGDSIGMVMSPHASHEMAAWNLAIGAAFLATASRPRRAAGLIPLLATFVVVLGALSVHDLAAGVVSWERLATHLCAVLGLALLLLLDRCERASPPQRWVGGAGATDSTDTGASGLRGVA